MQFLKPIKRLAILCFLLFQGISPALAQQPLWRSLDVEDGVPDPSVTSFQRLPNGLLFIGTSSGLYRFDGLNYNKIDFPASLKINPFINCITTDGSYIFAGARNALVRYSLKDESLLIFKNTQTFYAGVNKMIFSYDSSMMVCYTHAGFILLDSRNGNLRLIDSIPCSGVMDFRIARDGVIYYAAQRNLYSYVGSCRDNHCHRFTFT
ncbi:MAG: hypothetical protein IPH88_00105 [Bacteroidales bacterium]|nr:hypothetical protein [Bacteroidales bacterium]